ncbi:hypothetical protein PoB_004867400 [Plakobranchus ocellatus]|uniref:Uncharacterized protein n=1 Tax=Plakobranchus ocellatus TaxID=259542 RepID=A0AAV4BUU8_9GAST|nr:hypothetical protein PoB_004867400 [Plakobranchus ocellatus]
MEGHALSVNNKKTIEKESKESNDEDQVVENSSSQVTQNDCFKSNIEDCIKTCEGNVLSNQEQLIQSCDTKRASEIDFAKQSMTHSKGTDASSEPLCTCKKRCWKMFTRAERQATYENFWNLATCQDRQLWLQLCIRESCDYTGLALTRQRCVYKKYQLPLIDGSGRSIQVCSTFFMRTLGMNMTELIELLTLQDSERRVKDGKSNIRCKNSLRDSMAKEKIQKDAITDVMRHTDVKNEVDELVTSDLEEPVTSDVDEPITSDKDKTESVEKDTTAIDDLGDDIATLFVRRALRLKPPSSNRSSNQSPETILNSFNTTYPMHTMRMSHFIRIFQSVLENFKEEKSGPSKGLTGNLKNSSSVTTESIVRKNPKRSVGSRTVAKKSRVKTNHSVLKNNTCADAPFDTIIPDNNRVQRRSTRSTRMMGIMNESLMSKASHISKGHIEWDSLQKEQVLPETTKTLSSVSDLSDVDCDSNSLTQLEDEEEPAVTHQGISEAMNSSKPCQADNKHCLKGRRKRGPKRKYSIRSSKTSVQSDSQLSDKSTQSALDLYSQNQQPKRKCKEENRVLKYKHKHPMLPPCNCTHKNCTTKITEEQRRNIHEAFWTLVSIDARKEWLMRYVERIDPRKNIKSFLQHRKYISKKYFLPDSSGTKVEVCRLFFIHTLGFKWDSMIDNIIRTKLPVIYVPTKERRCTRPMRSIPEFITESIRQYVELIKNSGNVLDSTFEPALLVRNYCNSCGLEKETALSIKNTPGAKLKILYRDYRIKNKNLRFNLGYHSFRRICQKILSERESQEPDAEITGATYLDRLLKSTIFRNSLPSEKNSRSWKAKCVCDKEKTNSAVSDEEIMVESLKDYQSKADNKRDDSGAGDQSVSLSQNSSEQHMEILSDSESCELDVGSGYFKDPNSTTSTLVPILQNKTKSYKRTPNKNERFLHPVLPPCKCAKKKCFEKFSEKHRQDINDQFWDLPSYNHRKQWILEHIKRCDVKRRRVDYFDKPFRKTETRLYFLSGSDGTIHEVCKTFFLATLGYKWDSIIDTIHRTTARGDPLAAPDGRGRKPPPHKITEEAIASMSKYIEAVCVMHRDLYKAKSQRATKSGELAQTGNLRHYGLTMKQLFTDYKSKYPNHKFGYESFRKIFKHVYSATVLSQSTATQQPQGPKKEPMSEEDVVHPTGQCHAQSSAYEQFGEDSTENGSSFDDQDEDLHVYPIPPGEQHHVESSLSEQPNQRLAPPYSPELSFQDSSILHAHQYSSSQRLPVSHSNATVHGCIFDFKNPGYDLDQAATKIGFQNSIQTCDSHLMPMHLDKGNWSSGQASKNNFLYCMGNQPVVETCHQFTSRSIYQGSQASILSKDSTIDRRHYSWHQPYDPLTSKSHYQTNPHDHQSECS